MSVKLPNVVLLVWDACRPDYAWEHAPNLRSLAADNAWFERAIAPAPWSLPSHASLFTGQYPAEHGVVRLGDSMDCVSLVDDLGDRGYTSYGVSANGFACQRTGFHADFDEFRYTWGREPYGDGVDVSGYALQRMNCTDIGPVRTAMKSVHRALTHDHPLKSVANLGAVAIGTLASRSRRLQRIPHPLFAADSGYYYDPEVNTAELVDLIRRETRTESPFFAFANYMDTHRPYLPDADKQRRHLGETAERSELVRLNESVAAPWPFLSAADQGTVAEEDVETVRGLYTGAVETVDEHLGRVLDALDATGQREETVIIVTSDHGENLGERDEVDRRRMGHEASVSDRVARVPLVIAHPALDDRRVSEPVSLLELYGLLAEDLPRLLAGELPLGGNGVASCQYPPAGGDRLYDTYPDVPTQALDNRITESSVAVYGSEWRVGMETTGERWARQDGEPAAFEDAPETLRAKCERQLSSLEDRRWTGDELSAADHAQLEALGYM